MHGQFIKSSKHPRVFGNPHAHVCLHGIAGKAIASIINTVGSASNSRYSVMLNEGDIICLNTRFSQKEQVVVIEFRREIPKSSFLTLDIYYEGSSTKFITLPTALLGPRTVRAMFPGKPMCMKCCNNVCGPLECNFCVYKATTSHTSVSGPGFL